ncbi:MAG: hypothetical protein AB1508_16765 [Pseudomonadota bacterium]
MIDIVAAMDDPALFGPWFQGESWNAWRAILKGAFALPMSGEERAFFRTVAERDPPAKRVRELWIVAGRRAGKDSLASVIAAHAASLFDQEHKLRPGERALCLALACDRDQAKIVLSYARSYFDDIALLSGMVTRRTASGFELDNRVDVAVGTNSFRSVRGRPILLAVLDEVAFYRDETSATPDEEVYRAIVPGMATLPGAMLIAISTPYRRAGLLYRKYRDHFGQDGDVLVIKAPSTLLNPTLDQAIIDRAMIEDPIAASAEWMAEFRTDIESFVSREAIDAVTATGCRERAPASGVRYFAFVDPSGGSSDSMTLAIAHRDADGDAVLSAIREWRPPFSPESVVAESAALLKAHGVHSVTGDRYAGEWPRERFRVHGIAYELSERTASDVFRDALPLLNSGRVVLLDHPRLIAQFCALERTTSRAGKDTISHPPRGHDDLAVSAAGALLAAADQPSFVVTPELLARAQMMPSSRPLFARRRGFIPPVESQCMPDSALPLDKRGQQ